jgi:gamma-glutamyltranspeptidase/glutathione hydrolase
MAFGTPGGDAQEQWTLQFFLNHIEFDMSLQEALDAPTLHSVHFPSSFYPREAYPGRVMVESRIDETVRNQLIQRGHQVIAIDGWSNGKVMAIKYDEQHNTIWGAVAPKGEVGYAIGW